MATTEKFDITLLPRFNPVVEIMALLVAAALLLLLLFEVVLFETLFPPDDLPPILKTFLV